MDGSYSDDEVENQCTNNINEVSNGDARETTTDEVGDANASDDTFHLLSGILVNLRIVAFVFTSFVNFF
jgi:hypothetical protein